MAEDKTALALLYADLGYKKSSVPLDVAELIKHKLAAADDRLREAGIDPKATAFWTCG